MRSLLLLVATLMLAAASLIFGFVTPPDAFKALSLGFGGLAFAVFAQLLGDAP